MPFTVVFNDDGTIDQVFKVGITGPANQAVSPENVAPKAMPNTISSHLHGKSVRNITSVTIVQSNPYLCIMQLGELRCWKY